MNSIHLLRPFHLPQLPVLDVSGQLLCQSGAINRYLAELVTKPGFVPKDLLVRAHCDMVHETAQELAKVVTCTCTCICTGT